MAAIGFSFGAILAAGAGAGVGVVPPPVGCAAAGAAMSTVANKAAARILSIHFSLLALLGALFFTDALSQHGCYCIAGERQMKRARARRSS
ncbi:MAG TPA: hypothetical protein VII48_00600 [Rhizomicrobium sp.]